MACGAHPDTLLVGHPGNDTWNHVWGYWWVSESLANGEWPRHTSLLSYPTGGTLYFIDTIQVVLSCPVTRLWGPAVAFNLLLIFGLALSAFSAWLLARHLTSDGIAAYVALVIYGASHLLGQAYNGISETVCAVDATNAVLPHPFDGAPGFERWLSASQRACVC